MAEKIAASHPDMVLLLGWQQPLTASFWKAMALPRDLGVSPINPKVFYLTDTAMEEFPAKRDASRPFYDHFQSEEETWKLIDVKLWLLFKEKPAQVFSEWEFGIHKELSLRKFRKHLTERHMETIKRCLEVMKNPEQ